MFRTIVLAIFCISYLNNFRENFAWKWEMPPSVCEAFSNTSIGYETPTPINVNSKKAIRVRTNSSLILKNGILIPLEVYNSGYALELHGFPFGRKLVETFGGVLCGKTYTFYETRFYVSDDLKHSSFLQIDGSGSPLTMSVIYKNEECRSDDECFHRRDGFVIENFLLDFSPIDRPLFYPVELLAHLLRKPGSKLIVPSFLVLASFDKLPFIFGYYAFYGSYIDLKTSKQYSCAIEILADTAVFPMSKRQFENSFPKLLNRKGESLFNGMNVRKPDGRIIYHAEKYSGEYV